jgi:hypothetical protein
LPSRLRSMNQPLFGASTNHGRPSFSTSRTPRWRLGRSRRACAGHRVEPPTPTAA